MALVLAIEPDPRQAAALKRVVKGQVQADLVLVDSKDAALASLAGEIPDLILVTALLPPRDEDDLTQRLKALEHAGHLQTLTIPMLACAAPEEPAAGSVFGKLRRKKKPAPIEGCDPKVFGDQIVAYLRRAAELKVEERAREQLHAESAAAEQRRLAEEAAVEREAVEDEMAATYRPGAFEEEFAVTPDVPATEPIAAASEPEPATLEQAAPADVEPDVRAGADAEVETGVEPAVETPAYRPAYTGMLGLGIAAGPQDARSEDAPVSIFKPDAGATRRVAATTEPDRAEPAAIEPEQEPEVVEQQPAAASESAFKTAAPGLKLGNEDRGDAATYDSTDVGSGLKPEGYDTADVEDSGPQAGTSPAAAQDFGAAVRTGDLAPLAAFETASSSVADEPVISAFETTSAPSADEQPAISAFETASPSVADEPVISAFETTSPSVADEPVISALETTSPSVADEPVISALEIASAPSVDNEPVISALETTSAPSADDQPAISAFDTASAPPAEEPAPIGDEPQETGTDNERALEPWERLLREIAAQQEALQAEAARAAEEAARRAAAAEAEAAKAAEEALRSRRMEPTPSPESFAGTSATGDEERPFFDAALHTDERLAAPIEVASEIPTASELEDSPQSLTEAPDADSATATAGAAQWDRRSSDRWQEAATEAEPALVAKRSAAKQGALARALGPLHAFVTRMTSNRKAAADLLALHENDSRQTSTEADREPVVEPVPEAAAHEPEQLAAFSSEPRVDEEDDWRDVTRMIAREPATERLDRHQQAQGDEAAARDADSKEAQDRASASEAKDEPPPVAVQEDAAPAPTATEPQTRRDRGTAKKKKRRRTSPREKRARDFDEMVARLDGAWVASAIAALRTDIERLRQDTLAAAPPPAPRRDEEIATADANGKGDAQGQEPAAEPQPVQDEWGFYDPGRCGIQALMAKLDEKDGEKKGSAMAEVIDRDQKRAASQRPAAAPNHAGHSEGERAGASEDKRLAPLAVWARAGEDRVEYDARYVLPPEDVPRLPGMSQALRLADHVSAVRYASGCRIRRVRVAPGPKSPPGARRQVVILSRKMLDEAP